VKRRYDHPARVARSRLLGREVAPRAVIPASVLRDRELRIAHESAARDPFADFELRQAIARARWVSR
jgi:hypothetical protein